MGRKGRKNCRVMGKIRELRRAVAIKVLKRGPGSWMTERQKMPTMARNRYCPS